MAESKLRNLSIDFSVNDSILFSSYIVAIDSSTFDIFVYIIRKKLIRVILKRRMQIGII